MDLELIMNLEVLPEKLVFTQSKWLGRWARERHCSCRRAASLGPRPAPGAFASSPPRAPLGTHHPLSAIGLIASGNPREEKKIQHAASYDSLISMYVQMHHPNEAMPLQQTAGWSIAEASEYHKNFLGKRKAIS